MVRSRSVEANTTDGGGSGGGGRPPPPNPAMPYREDCWSEGATSTLIDAWGDRYVELKRGNLRQKHWQEVADAVNARRTAVKRPSRTDVQCKNRIDTIKKKYKSEKARIAESGGGSQWPFFDRVENLIGSSASASAPAPAPAPLSVKRTKGPEASPSASPPLPLAASVPSKKRPGALMGGSSLRWGNYSAAAAAAAAAREDEADSESSRSIIDRSAKRRVKRVVDVNGGFNGGGGEEGDGVKELARAILKFGEIYERVEMAKQRQMIEMEKQRLEFNKDLEFQKMQMFIDSQVQLRKIKRAKREADASGDAPLYCDF